MSVDVYSHKNTNAKKGQKYRTPTRFLLIALCIILLFLGLATNTTRAADADVSKVNAKFNRILCSILNIAQGTAGKTIVVLVILTTAGGAFFGKLNPATVVVAIIGVVLIMGAENISNMFFSDGEGGSLNCDSTE